MAITRLPVVDDTGDGRSGTAITAAWWTQVQDMIDARWTIGVAAPAGVANDMVTGECDVILVSNTAPVTITGLAAPATPPKAGKVVRLIAVGAAPIYFAHNDARSAPTSRLLNPVTSGPTPIAPLYGSITYAYLGPSGGNQWLLVGHQQGPWIDVPFTAAAFPNTSMVVGNIETNRYSVVGNTLSWAMRMQSAAGSGTPALQILLPGGYQTQQCVGHVAHCYDSGAAQYTQAYIERVAATTITLNKQQAGNWVSGIYAYWSGVFPLV